MFCDLVICSEVIEHIDDYRTAIYNLCRMSKAYVVITTPFGKLYEIDKALGHYKFPGEDAIKASLNDNGFDIIEIIKWGFPFYLLQKYFIDILGAKKIHDAYAKKFSLLQRFVSYMIYLLFFVNDLFIGKGCQLVILARRRDERASNAVK